MAVCAQEEEENFIITYGSLGILQALAYLAAVLQVGGRGRKEMMMNVPNCISSLFLPPSVR